MSIEAISIPRDCPGAIGICQSACVESSAIEGVGSPPPGQKAFVRPKRVSARKLCRNTHVARSQLKLLQEWHAFHTVTQINISGDDMNTIQVGCEPVPQHQKVLYDVHDFPNAELGLKLGRAVSWPWC